MIKATELAAGDSARLAPAGSQVLKHLRITGGFLDGSEFDLADGLNCLIGARGTGKTTVLELIRFALDMLPSPDGDPAGRRRVDSLIEENLTGGQVEMTIGTKEGMT